MSRFFKKSSRMSSGMSTISMPALAAGDPAHHMYTKKSTGPSPLSSSLSTIDGGEISPLPRALTSPQQEAFMEHEYFIPYDQHQVPVIIVPSGKVEAHREVLHVGFTPSDVHVVATVHGSTFDRDGKQTNNVLFWDSRTLKEGHMDKTDRLKNSEAPKAVGNVAFSNRDVLSCLFPRTILGDEEYGSSLSYSKPYRLEMHDLTGQRRLMKSDVPIRAPVAVSRDGTFVAGVSSTGSDANLANGRILLMRVNGPNKKDAPAAGPPPVSKVDLFPIHLDEVTHLQFMPNGREVMSLSKDGTGRLTSLKNGASKGKFEVHGRPNPKILQVAPDGKLVASVWGYEVMLWSPSTGQSTTYSLTTVRRNEGWPLCISPDCRYLACRTEIGFDIMELMTGRFLGETTEVQRASWITSGAFNNNGTMIAIGTYTGSVQLYKLMPGS